MKNRILKIGLALGGGGVKGFAHIGALKVLGQNDIKIDLIVGSSIGAIVGAAYSLYDDIQFLMDRAKIIADSKEIKELQVLSADSEPEEKKLIIGKFLNFVKEIYLWNIRRTKKWLIDSSSLVRLIKTIIPQDAQFSETKIPFACVATDLLKGEKVILNKGNLLEAVLASCSVPGVFPPARIKDRLLVDGGIVALVPAFEAKSLGADFVIGVNVEGLRLRDNFKGGVDILFQTDQIRTHWFNQVNLGYCDFVISPEVSDLSWTDFSQADFCVQKGIEATQKNFSQLRSHIHKKRLRAFLRRLLRL